MGALIQLLLSSQPNSFSCLAPEFLLPAFFRGDFFFDINRRKCQDDFLNALGKCKFFERQTNCAQLFACGDFFFVSVWQKLSWLKAEEVWGKSWERRYIEWFSPFLFYSISNNHQNQIHVKLHHHINFNFFYAKLNICSSTDCIVKDILASKNSDRNRWSLLWDGKKCLQFFYVKLQNHDISWIWPYCDVFDAFLTISEMFLAMYKSFHQWEK